MSFLSHAFSAFVGVHVLPYVIAGGAVLAVGGAIALKRGFNEASNAVSNGISNSISSINESIHTRKALQLLKNDDFPTFFAQSSRSEQSSLITRLLASHNEDRRPFNEKETGHVVEALKHHTKQMTYDHDFYQIAPIMKFLEQNKGKIAEGDVMQITSGALDCVKSVVRTSDASLADVVKLSVRYGNMMNDEQKAACREHIIGALEKPAQSLFGGAPSYALKMQALDILFVPKYAHGGEKSTAHLSLEKGGYTADEQSRIIRGAQNYISQREDAWAREQKNFYPSLHSNTYSERKAEEVLIAQIKTKIGPIEDAGTIQTFKDKGPQLSNG